MNVADSQLMSGILERNGYLTADSVDDADVILVNTCAVRERAEERVIARLKNLHGIRKRRKGTILGVCGCMAEHLRDKILDQTPVDLIVGPDSYRRLPDLIDAVSAGALVIDVQLDKHEVYEGAAESKVDGIRGWISIQRGCDKFCTFCIVPFVRGRERSAPPREVLRQARALVAQGAAELTLLGQTVNSYRHEEADFADLLTAVSEIDGVKRVRFTSPYPLDFGPKLIETMAANAKVMPYVHLPVQSGSNTMLAQMKRGYTVETFLDLVRDIRAAIPHVALSTDVIVGFPGETDRQFEKTLDLVRDVRFDSAFMFLYSERSHTYAKRNLPDNIPLDLKKGRLNRLIALQEEISAEINATYVGKRVPVLVTGPSRRSQSDLTGKTDTFKSAVFPAPKGGLSPGDLVSMTVTDTTSHTLRGQLAAS
jgi:tRNA-2-methylthio-N6-dimethylallyladenosine synthase